MIASGMCPLSRWAVMVSLVFAGSAQAAPRPKSVGPSEQEIARCISKAGGGRMWLEKTLWGLRDQEGGWLGAEVANADGSHDLGPLQVNSWWVPRLAQLLHRPEADVRTWLKSDACFNIETARWIYLSALRVTGDYWAAVGAYHSPTRWRGQAYARGVVGHLARRFGPETFHRSAGVATSADPKGRGGARARPSVESVFGFGVATSAIPSTGAEN